MKPWEGKALGELFAELTYAKGSLCNRWRGGEAVGFSFSLRNPPLALGGVAVSLSLWVDGVEADPARVWIRQREGCRHAGTIRPETPWTFAVGEPSEWTVEWPGGLSPGEHEIVIVTEQFAFGEIYSRFVIRDEVRDLPEPALVATDGLGRPVALSNDFSFAVCNRAGDLSADWNWLGLVTDNGGLYGPPARYVRSVRWGLRDGQSSEVIPLRFHTEGAALLPARLEAWSRIGPLDVRRTVFMPRKECAVITVFDVTNRGGDERRVELVSDVEAMLVPYGLLGVTPKHLRFTRDQQCVVLEHPLLPYVGVWSCDRPFDTDFGRVRESDQPVCQLRVPLLLKPGEQQTVTVVVSGDPSDGVRAIAAAKDCMREWRSRLNETIQVHQDFLEQTRTVETGDAELDQAFLFAKLALRLLKWRHPEIGTGVCAGFPRFPNYWGRDSAWTGLAYLAIGDTRFVKDILHGFFSRQLTEDQRGAMAGDVPTVISGSAFMHQMTWGGSADGVLLLVILLERYVRETGDDDFAGKMWDAVRRAIAWAERMDTDGDGFLEHGIQAGVSTSQAFTIPDTQWMDHIDRRKSANDVQGLYWEMLRSAARLAERLGHLSLAQCWRSRADELEERYEAVYWNDRAGAYYDRLCEDGTPDPTIRPNYAVNLIFSTRAPADRVVSALARLEAEDVTTPFGVRTRSSLDAGHGYDPSGYQEGAVWNLTTGWVAYAELKAGRIPQGIRYLRMIARRILDEFGMCAELYRATHPEPLNGCFLQAWSVGVYVWCLAEFHEIIAQFLRESDRS